MPSFHARSTTIRLSTAPLATTTTTKPFNKQCLDGSADIERIADEFAQASKDSTLSETAIVDEQTGSHLRFLGNHKDMPFFIVRAGQSFSVPNIGEREIRSVRKPGKGLAPASTMKVVNADGESGGKRKRGDLEGSSQSTTLHPSLSININQKINALSDQPQALCLEISLSHHSFISKTPFIPTPARKDIHDIQILAYLNGELTASAFVPQQHSQPDRFNIVRLTGTRCEKMIEKPWILASSGVQPFPSNSDTVGAEARWAKMSQALQEVAQAMGTNKLGERCASGEWFESLAKLKCPKEMEGLSQSFGCLDVVVVYGKGRKDAHGRRNMYGPGRMRDETFTTTDTNGDAGTGRDGDLHPVVGGLKLASVMGYLKETVERTPKPARDSPDPLAMTPQIPDRLEKHLAAHAIDGLSQDSRTKAPPHPSGVRPRLSSTSPGTVIGPLMPSGSSIEPHPSRSPTPPGVPTFIRPELLTDPPQSSLANFSSPELPLKQSRVSFPVRRGELKALTSMHPLTTDLFRLPSHKQSTDKRLTRSATVLSATSTRNSSPLSSVPSEDRGQSPPSFSLPVLNKLPGSGTEGSSTHKKRKLITLSYRSSPASSGNGTPVTRKAGSSFLANLHDQTLSFHGAESHPFIPTSGFMATATPPAMTHRASRHGGRSSFEPSPAQTRNKRQGTGSKSVDDQHQEELTSSLAQKQTTTALRVDLPQQREKKELKPVPGLNIRAADDDFGTSGKLEEGCVVAFAPEGVVRNVGAVREGWFKEEGVLMGVRFLLG